MHAKYLTSLRDLSLIAGGLLAFTGVQAASLPSDAFPTFESYVKISGQAPSITGNDAAYQRRMQQPKDGAVGIEDLFYTKDVNDNTTLQIDGHALFGAEDYLGKLLLTKGDVGSVEVGYKSFRTFYDGIGGFFPLNQRWNAMNPEDLHVDRGEFWATARWTPANGPVFELKYVDGSRNGKKDDTVWGDSDFTGLPNNNPPISQVRKMVASYRDLDETHKTLEGSMNYTMGNTTLFLSIEDEHTDDIDTRYTTRFPGEAKPFPTPPSTVLLPPSQMNNQVQYYQTDGMKTHLFQIMAKSETIMTEKLSMKLGFNYQTLDSDFTGDRPLLTTTPTAVGIVIAPSNNYLNLTGGSAVDVYVGSIAFDYKPTKDSLVSLGVRGEDQYTKSSGSLTAVTASVNTTTGVITTKNDDQVFNSRVKSKSYTPVLDLRYSGFKDIALYASASVKKVDGDQRYVTPYNPITNPAIPNSNQAYNDMSEDRTSITVGANWHACAFATFRGEIFHKENTNNAVGYTKRSDGYVDNYDLDYNYNGFKLTAILKPIAQLSSTTRYVYQKGEATVTGISVTGDGSVSTPYVAAYPKYDSMDMENHMISETIDWSPSTQFYMQGNVNVVFNVISTVYPRAGMVAPNGSTQGWDANGVLQNANNNYITASILAGAVITKADDLQFKYTYYKADNYNPELANRTMPYGAGATEHVATVGLVHKFSKRCMGDAKIGYFDSKNDTTGGNTNFRGPMAYLSLTYAL